jgi:hypothetical protein
MAKYTPPKITIDTKPYIPRCVRHREMSEMGDGIQRPQRLQRALQGSQRVHHGA